MKRRVISLLCLGVGLTVTLNAQDVTGNLEGWVFDTTRHPVVGANVVAGSASLQGIRGTISDERGFFRILSLPTGRYVARISHVAHKTVRIKDVRVGLGITTGLGEIQLLPKSLEIGDVVVVAERQLLDPKSNAAGENLLLEDIKTLPMERNYRSVASLLPNVNQSYYGDEANVAGGTGSENRYFINGTDVTDPYRGVGGMNLPYNFIREVQVKVGGYDPEYRSSLGGILNVVTYSGGNEFSGQTFGFYTNNSFSSEQQAPATEPPRGAYSLYDVGISLGGPVIRDKIWFFAAYSPSFRSEEVSLPGVGYQTAKFKADLFAGKLTWKASEAFELAATLLGDPTREDAVGKAFGAVPPPLNMTNPDPYLARVSTGGLGIIADGQYVAGDNTLLRGSVSWTSRTLKYWPRTDIGATAAWFFDNETATLSGGYPERVDNTSSTASASVAATYVFTSHTVKSGIEYKDVGLDVNNKYSVVIRFNDTSYISNEVVAAGTIRNRLPSAFIQDSWVLNEHVRINGGIRWDGLFIVGSDGKVGQRILGQFQPRVGVVFLPRGDGTQKLFLTAGRFAEDLLMFGSTMYHLAGGHNTLLSYTHDPRLDPTGADTVSVIVGMIQQNLPDLRGQYYDEVTVGYEQAFDGRSKLTVRGVYRTLREVLEDAEYPIGSENFVYANPGHDPLSAYASPRREYLALELSLQTSLWEKLNIFASYVLSRNYGNYHGFYWQDYAFSWPNTSTAFDYLDLENNSTGLLPNNRTHVFKANVSYSFPFGLNLGASLLWQSGTPLSEYGMSQHGPYFPIFIRPRGTAGSLPSICDLSLRFSYDILQGQKNRIRPRLILDIFHVSNQRTVVRQDQSHYYNQDSQGNQIDPNLGYGHPLSFMPPRSIRLGMEIDF